VASLPATLEDGVLYVVAHFHLAAHLCACGCGREVVTPLSTEQWTLTLDGSASLWPSINNASWPCKSHYILKNGAVAWSSTMTAVASARARKADEVLLAAKVSTRRTWLERMRRRLPWSR
jgi:hypothetical protein